MLAVLASWAGSPAMCEAGWITLTSGASGSALPTGTAEFWYGSSSTPPLVAIDTLSGAGTVQAVTGGGTAFFTGLGVPVLLDLSDGSAYLAGGSPPAGATARGPEGTATGAPASAAPQAGLPVPDGSSRLGVALAPGEGGSWVLTASVLGSGGEGLGSGSVVVPESGWWVLGLGPNQQPAPEPLPEPPPPPTPEPVPEPSPSPSPSPSPAPGVPEPATAALAASGLFLALPWFRRKRRSRGRS